MCGSSLDECVPAFLERENDYRGCSPYYRAGSIYHGENIPGGEIALAANRTDNAGHFGVTTPVSQAKGTGRQITLPPAVTGEDDTDFRMPTMEELKKGTRQTPPISLPKEGPERPGTGRPARTPDPTQEPNLIPRNGTIETIPFTGPITEEPRFTVEELRRLEGSGVTDIKILNIEDSLDTASDAIPWK